MSSATTIISCFFAIFAISIFSQKMVRIIFLLALLGSSCHRFKGVEPSPEDKSISVSQLKDTSAAIVNFPFRERGRATEALNEWVLGLSDKVDTLYLTYYFSGCDCTRWVENKTFQKAKKNGENLSGEDFRGAIEFSDTHSYYIEAAKGAIRIPNDIEVNGNTARFVGRLYSYNCLPNDGEFTDPFPPRGKVFRYYEYEVVRPFKIRAIYNPPTKNDSVIYLTFPKNIQ